MEYEERKIAKVYAIIALYTIILLVVGILLGFAVGRQYVISEREIQSSDTTQVERVTTTLTAINEIVNKEFYE